MKITVADANGMVKAQEEGTGQAILAWEGTYEEGDRIEFSVPEPGTLYEVRVDDTMGPDLVYLTETTVIFEIPFGQKKDSYNPKAFTGTRHYLTLRRALPFEAAQYRNLAKNGMDQHGDKGCFPHAWANVETRGEAVFAARNAIDGVIATRSHGKWPYQSWGINRQDDAQITIEFGRPVVIDRLVLYTRADFPHDNWWEQAMLTFSDGASLELELKKGGGAQVFPLPEKQVMWIRLDKLQKADGPSPFPALAQIEVYGKDA